MTTTLTITAHQTPRDRAETRQACQNGVVRLMLKFRVAECQVIEQANGGTRISCQRIQYAQ